LDYSSFFFTFFISFHDALYQFYAAQYLSFLILFGQYPAHFSEFLRHESSPIVATKANMDTVFETLKGLIAENFPKK
jgi:hypothetical protein